MKSTLYCIRDMETEKIVCYFHQENQNAAFREFGNYVLKISQNAPFKGFSYQLDVITEVDLKEKHKTVITAEELFKEEGNEKKE